MVSNVASPALLTSFSVVTNGYSVSTNRLSLSQAMPTMTFSDFSGVTNLVDELTKYAPIDIIHGASQSSFPTVRATYPQKIILKQDAWAGIGMDTEDLTNVYPGHLLLKLGTLLTNDCATNDTVLYVQDYTRIASQQSVVDGITNSIESYVLLYARTNGVPDWSRAEHVRLVAVDTNTGAITVNRAQLGSKALSFTNGQAVLARHMMFWTNPNGGQWSLNFSLQCPRGGPFNETAAEWYAWRKMQIISFTRARPTAWSLTWRAGNGVILREAPWTATTTWLRITDTLMASTVLAWEHSCFSNDSANCSARIKSSRWTAMTPNTSSAAGNMRTACSWKVFPTRTSLTGIQKVSRICARG